MARRSEHSQEQLKTMILCTAEQIITRQGISALTVRRIAGQIGYTVGSIYMVFDNMADLILHVNARTLDDLAAHLQQVQNNAEGPCLETLAQAYLGYAIDNSNRWKLIFDCRWTENAVFPDWYKNRLDQVVAPIGTELAKLAQGNCPEQENKHAAQILWAAIHGVCALALTGKPAVISHDDSESGLTLLVRQFLRGRASSVQQDGFVNPGGR